MPKDCVEQKKKSLIYKKVKILAGWIELPNKTDRYEKDTDAIKMVVVSRRSDGVGVYLKEEEFLTMSVEEIKRRIADKLELPKKQICKLQDYMKENKMLQLI